MNRLRIIRAEKRITQFDLRIKTGINQSKISLAENGYIELRDDEKERIAKALNCAVADIFTGAKLHRANPR